MTTMPTSWSERLPALTRLSACAHPRGHRHRCGRTDTPLAERDVAVLFPGQGTQKVGMAGKLLESTAVQADARGVEAWWRRGVVA